MKRNLIRFIIVVLLATAWFFYLHWPKPAYEDQRKAQEINCVNNLKQIGLGFRIWSGDHGDKYPFDVGTNAGGTMELTPAGADARYENAYLFLQVMSNELTMPTILICPQDRSKIVAANWASVSASNVTYEFPVGTNGIIAICPIDGNILYSDGTVASTNKAVAESAGHDGQFPIHVSLPDNKDLHSVK